MERVMDEETPACAECLKHDGGWAAWCDECRLRDQDLAYLRARLAEVAEVSLAEVEAERDNTPFIAHWKGRAEAAEARLAEVEAVLEAHRGMGPKPGMDSAGYDLWSDVADAAARGEGTDG
jgi:hypothetical protein